jgi:hypothetical protein
MGGTMFYSEMVIILLSINFLSGWLIHQGDKLQKLLLTGGEDIVTGRMGDSCGNRTTTICTEPV